MRGRDVEATEGRLRELKVINRPTSDGRSTVSFRTFIVEVPFREGRNIQIGHLMAVETLTGEYLVLEVADMLPVHFAAQGLDGSVPLELRNEIMRRIDENWREEDPKDVWLDIYAVPVGYLVTMTNGEIKARKGYSPPLPGSRVVLFSETQFNMFVNNTNGTELGRIRGLQTPLKVNIESMLKYHTGIFAFTGSGKSNLIASIIRRAVRDTKYRVIVLDISMEYAPLLMDVLLEYPSTLVTTESIPKDAASAAKKLMRGHVLPDGAEDIRGDIHQGFLRLAGSGRIREVYIPPQSTGPILYQDLIDMLTEQINDKYTSRAQVPILHTMLREIDEMLRTRKVNKGDMVSEEILEVLERAEEEGKEAKLKENASIFTFINSLKTYVSSLGKNEKESEEAYDLEKLSIDISDRDTKERLFIIETQSLTEGRVIVSSLINSVFERRKRSFSSDSPIVFVLDEAQEFIPYDTRTKDRSEESNEAVERLLRHGRKYHLHGIISTQRLAYLNTNALQQLHTYFVSTLPRPYDRQLVAETFGISDSILERTLELEVGNWLLISFRSALPHDVPVFMESPNNLEEMRRGLRDVIGRHS